MPDIDLNLLGVFDALYELRSVTKAAQRLNLTQSAVSHALGRLRLAVGDPLFLRAAGGLQPTARALEMARGVREGLTQLRGALAPTAFDPATAVRTMTIAAGAYFCALLIPELIARGRARAPGVTFRIVPAGSDLLTGLDDGVVDLALGAFARMPARLSSEVLYSEDLVWIAAAGNRLADVPLPKQRRLLIASTGTFEPSKALFAEGALEPQLLIDAGTLSGLADDNPVVVYDALTAAAIVARTDIVALVPRRIAQIGAEQWGLSILETPDHGRGIDLAMLWPARSEGDAGLIWLRGQIAELAR